jgi:hypothetical protein
MLLSILAKGRTSMKKDELFQEVKAGKISLKDFPEALGHERVDHLLIDTKMTNEELLQQINSTPAATEVEKNECCVCKELSGTLQNEDYSWICEDCAQYMSDLGHELSL